MTAPARFYSERRHRRPPSLLSYLISLPLTVPFALLSVISVVGVAAMLWVGGHILLVNLSGRGDKDMGTALDYFGLGTPDSEPVGEPVSGPSGRTRAARGGDGIASASRPQAHTM